MCGCGVVFNARSARQIWGFGVPESKEMEGRANRDSHRQGLEILFLKPDPKIHLAGLAERDLPSELRERYWIRAAQDAGIGNRSWASFSITMPWGMERHELGRNRNEPGDGFRYVFQTGSARIWGGEPSGSK